jgi:hypothetical protein
MAEPVSTARNSAPGVSWTGSATCGERARRVGCSAQDDGRFVFGAAQRVAAVGGKGNPLTGREHDGPGGAKLIAAWISRASWSPDPGRLVDEAVALADELMNDGK